jgi:uncharacterized protein (DUF885 family)
MFRSLPMVGGFSKVDRRGAMGHAALGVGLVAGVALGADLATAAPAPSGAAPAPANPEEGKLSALFDSIMTQSLDRSPETVTGLGLDKGDRAGAKARLDDRSLAAIAADKVTVGGQLAALRKIDRAKLTGLARTNYDSVLFGVALQDEMMAKLPYVGSPYAITQLTGAYQGLPDFLDSQHSIETSADAESYLARLAALATAVDQESEQLRHDVALGVVPPDFVLAKALVQLRALASAKPDKSNLVQSVARRTRDKGIAGPWEARASAIYTAKVQPALARQIAALAALQPRAVHTAGVARLPHGEELYRLSLLSYTTSTMGPAEIHKTGLDLIAAHQAQIDTILRGQGMTQGTVGQRLAALYKQPDQLYANTDTAKQQLLADLNQKVAVIMAKLPQSFGALPKARLDIRRVPKEIEAGAPGGYYQSGTLDGSRPGAYYINLRDTAEVPRWTLPTLTFHEGIPGHHLQGSLAQEAPLPMIRKVQFFSGYGEGWALYAEQLAVEMGLYENDPLGHVGQLHDSMFRAVRLVVDSGMHAMGWSREQAVRFYCDTLGTPESGAATEIERYCVWPGQACSYMLGKLTWLRLREKAKAALGPRFDIRKFHDAGLLAGAMPLTVLESCIDDYIATSKA